jgi:alkanesulfonate monooxygenase SsuD/methylene tetrahydromethanopterin reductase-like flavin-dependent oxidoreductase (luciferase family)
VNLVTPTEPFGSSSVSLRLYPHDDLDATELIDEMCAQAVLAMEHGFHGVMTSEHHGGFGGYIPNPLQAAGWMLEAMPTGWAAPCPMLLPVRPVALVAEEAAWFAARFPGRVGIGVAAGALAQDFEILDTPMDDLTQRFADGLASLTRHLRGEVMTNDQALRRCGDHPVPVVSAAMGFMAARRAAACGAGLVFDSMSSSERVAALIDAYRVAGGAGPTILIRRAWVGAPPAELFDKQIGVYRTYAATAAQNQWETDELISGDDVVERLRDVQARSTADALNIRLHVPGVRTDSIREQIELLGRQLR